MKTATISELKKELKMRNPQQVEEFCLRLARFKKDNKELLTYLLFEADDEEVYIRDIKVEISNQFSALNRSNLYYTKKMLRKILRNTNKYIRYSGEKKTEVELLIFFCKELKHSGIPVDQSITLTNMYQNLLRKIKKSLTTLHEDLQYDYAADMKELTG